MTADLPGLFQDLQARLRTELSGVRATVSHPGALGADSEEGWRWVLSEYLPRRYCVSKAFVIDSRGERSEEIDLVIYDRQYSPFLLKHRTSTFIPAESVYAVLEVKQRLDRRTFAAAVQKAASVRRLYRTSAAIEHAGGRIEKPQVKVPFRQLAGLVCLGGGWKPAFGDRLAREWEAAPELGRLDLLCSLENGAADLRAAEEGAGLCLETSPPGSALIWFFLRLMGRLQSLGTVPAIDLREYENTLK